MWKWKIGTVVREIDGSRGGLIQGPDARDFYGHVIGFSNNGFEPILKIQWEDGRISEIHPSNVVHEEDMKDA